MAAERAQGAQQEGRGRILSFIGQHLDISQPVFIIDGDMDKVPARAAVPAAGACAGDAVAGPVEAPELLFVAVDQITRPLALVATDGFGWFERG